LKLYPKKERKKEKVKKQCMTILGSDRRISLIDKSIVFRSGRLKA